MNRTKKYYDIERMNDHYVWTIHLSEISLIAAKKKLSLYSKNSTYQYRLVEVIVKRKIIK